MVRLERVSRTFDNGTSAFRDLSFSVGREEIVGILGTSGCGKSTLLRVIAGLDGRHQGSVQVEGRVGVIFQEPRLMPWLRVVDNVAFGLRGRRDERTQPAMHILERVGLSGFERLYAKELSGGMAQRVAIARALVTRPDILLLDEPFSALDAFTRMQLQDLLLDVWGEYRPTMMLVTHDIDEALYLCDRLLVLKGHPGELLREVDVDVPRVRARSDPRLVRMKEEILDLLGVVSRPSPVSIPVTYSVTGPSASTRIRAR